MSPVDIPGRGDNGCRALRRESARQIQGLAGGGGVGLGGGGCREEKRRACVQVAKQSGGHGDSFVAGSPGWV